VSDRRTVIARIGRPHGLRGEVTVQVHTDEPERRLAVGTVVESEAPSGSGAPSTLTVRTTRVHRGIWLIAFDDVVDRTGAERLRDTLLVVTGPPDTTTDDPQVWAESQLVGLRAVDPAGAGLGDVVGIEVGAAQDRLVIRLDDGSRAEVPFVAALVPEVDLEGGRVVVDAPAGLFDLGA
jgi:16S rRNA processing protein RimM